MLRDRRKCISKTHIFLSPAIKYLDMLIHEGRGCELKSQFHCPKSVFHIDIPLALGENNNFIEVTRFPIISNHYCCPVAVSNEDNFLA